MTQSQFQEALKKQNIGWNSTLEMYVLPTGQMIRCDRDSWDADFAHLLERSEYYEKLNSPSDCLTV